MRWTGHQFFLYIFSHVAICSTWSDEIYTVYIDEISTHWFWLICIHFWRHQFSQAITHSWHPNHQNFLDNQTFFNEISVVIFLCLCIWVSIYHNCIVVFLIVLISLKQTDCELGYFFCKWIYFVLYPIHIYEASLNFG